MRPLCGELITTRRLAYFARTVLKAQDHTLSLINFLIEKARLYDRLRGRLNVRQEKALAQLIREVPNDFKGGLSAENYFVITGASCATATRDLLDWWSWAPCARPEGSRAHDIISGACDKCRFIVTYPA